MVRERLSEDALATERDARGVDGPVQIDGDAVRFEQPIGRVGAVRPADLPEAQAAQRGVDRDAVTR